MARIFVERRDASAVDDELNGVLERLLEGSPLVTSRTECTLPLDVVETGTAVEVVMDLPGVAVDDLEIRFVRNTLVILGRKLPGGCEHAGAAFHLVERTFGRFVRAVPIAGAFDTSRADAQLRSGELHITLPRIVERRGTELRIPVRGE